MEQVYDVAIIGGGINGCGCAADAAIRGLKVVLLEQDSLASKTSSSSTKLIHGGLRYLEHYEFSLVKKALIERQILLDRAPHLVKPQAFLLPYQKHLRPFWFIRLGLFLYDHLSNKNRLPRCKTIRKNRKKDYFNPLVSSFDKGFLFYDAITDDARLTIANALQAKNYAASIRPHSKVIHIEVCDKIWHLTVQTKDNKTTKIRAKSLINATGPWAESLAKLTHTQTQRHLTLVKGSHILVPKLYEGSHAYFLQHKDKRVIFIIPYHDYSMIGTTDVAFNGSLEQDLEISSEEIDYLLGLSHLYFRKKLNPEDIISSWSGIRPLLAQTDTSLKKLSRDYYHQLTPDPAPVVTIFGGKITTYRQLAKECIDDLACIFPNLPPSQTDQLSLPGANLDTMNFNQYQIYAKEKYSWLSPTLLHRYLFTYGCNTEQFLANCSDINTLGIHYGATLYQVELDYLIAQEWATSVEDVLERHTKLGLNMDAPSKLKLQQYFNELKELKSSESLYAES